MNRLFSVVGGLGALGGAAGRDARRDDTSTLINNANQTTALLQDAKLLVNYYTPQDDIKIPVWLFQLTLRDCMV